MSHVRDGIAEDIDLQDLWLALLQRKVLFIGIFIFVLAIGATIIFVYPRNYSYSMIFQIGGQRPLNVNTDVREPYVQVESSEDLITKIQTNYIPQVSAEHDQEHPEWLSYTFDLSSPNKSDLVLVTTTATSSRDADVLSFMRAIAEMASARENAELKSQILLTKQLLQQRQDELQAQIDAAQKARNQIVAHGSDINKAFTVLMLDNQIAAQQEQLNVVKEELQIGLTADVRYTEIISEPTRSVRPIGLSRALSVALTGCLGLFLGGFGVWLATFFQAASMRSKSKNNNGKG